MWQKLDEFFTQKCCLSCGKPALGESPVVTNETPPTARDSRHTFSRAFATSRTAF